MPSHRRGRSRRGGPVALAAVAVLGLALAAVAVLVHGSSGTVGPVAHAAPPPAAAPAPPAGIADQASCPPQVSACVDLRTHQSWLQRDGDVVYGPVPFLPGADTGRRAPGPTSSATPTGLFHVQRKDADAVSHEYGEPMPHAVYFAPGGIAFHEGSLTESSHGCIHLEAPDATAFFGHLAVGDDVLVFS
ncbi:L,D-transpeptidase-like protein [Actinomycetospora succinea]|uniref:L,D-transpeptidase-like protein n=1 Tax=Actinomycetospora succinea TaxID=663603 RepID=A0A4R6VRE2_9PSEU|nr:L,D-transpeptidase [Actinomycetospora succinea]TDQ65124.1 L,D-transpeptidase-like protein [Actinomycetospora succinea]